LSARNVERCVQIAEGLDVVLISANEVLVQFGTRSQPSELLRDDDLTGVLGTVVSIVLRGPARVEDMLAAVRTKDRDDASELIDDLLARGILADVATAPVEQYLRYTLSGDNALADRSVSLIGAGPTGGRLAHSLLQLGVGGIAILDDRRADALWQAFTPFGPALDPEFDATASASLRAQLVAAGHSGVDALDAGCDADGIEATAKRSDLVVLALEQPNLRLAHLVNRICLRERKPWLLATIDGNLGLVGPLFLPFQTACFNDFRVLSDAATPSPEMARLHRRHIVQRETGSFFPGLPAYAELVAGHASLAACHFLLRGTSFALGRVLVMDFDRMRIDVEDVLRLPRCPVCGSGKAAHRAPASVDLRVIERAL
jgi:bacteriocin biosynthesis cyclodehydratase domain-containing protein